MKYLFTLFFACTIIGCGIDRHATTGNYRQDLFEPTDPPVTQSLFDDKSSTISEENIQKILSGGYTLPAKIRVAVIQLETHQKRSPFWNDEDDLKNQQAYLQTITEQLLKSARVAKVTIMPDLMVARPVSVTRLREAAVRMQADVLVIYSTITDTYSKYKVFTKTDIKAFATTQVVVLDTRTALVPFTVISTKDFLSQKTSTDLDIAEARKRIQNEAVKLTIADAAAQLSAFLK